MKMIKFTLTLLSLATFSTTLIAQSPAPIDAGPDITICYGDSATLTAINPWGAPISWDNGVANGVPFLPISTVNYIVTANNLGVLSYDTVTVFVETLPLITFSTSNTGGCVPYTSILTSQSQGSSGIASEVWDIETIGSMSGNTVSPTFTQGGAFDVTLTVTSNYGCSSTATYIDFIYVEDNPVSSYLIDAPICLPSNVTFMSTSTGAVSCVWNISNGDSYTGCGPLIHTFTNSGYYDVELITYSALGCTDTLNQVSAFEVNECVNLEELFTDQKQLIKIVDIMGRETLPVQNIPLFYMYSDGIVERKVIVEE